MMKKSTRITAGLTVLTLPTIEFGGYFLFNILSGREAELGLTAFQESMFRAGHAHAGVLVVLALVALILLNAFNIKSWLYWVICTGFPAASVLISAGFFLSAIGSQLTQPNALIALIHIGAAVLAASSLALAFGLLRTHAQSTDKNGVSQ